MIISIWVGRWFRNSFGRFSLHFFLLWKFELITVWIRMSELSFWLFFELKTITLVQLLLMKGSFFHVSRSTNHIFVSMSHKRSLIAEEEPIGRRRLPLSFSYSLSYIYLVSFFSLLLIILTAILTHVDAIVFCQLFSFFHHHRVLMSCQILPFSWSLDVLADHH